MTAAFEESATRKEQAALRSLCDSVASPIVAGKHAKGCLSSRQRLEWTQITNTVCQYPDITSATAAGVARSWKRDCQAVGIGAGLLGWFLWNWAFPLLLELAARWIESKRQAESRVSDR